MISKEKTIERLKNEIKFVENKIHQTEERQAKFELSKQYHQLKIDLLKNMNAEDSTRPGKVATKYIEEFENLPVMPKMRTGVRLLDETLKGGISHGNLVGLAGQSFVGKSHLLFEILANVTNTLPSVFFNFEMNSDKVVKKLKKFLPTKCQLENLIIDDSSRNLDDLIMEITLYADQGHKLFVIDSMMKISSKIKEMHIHFDNITKALSELCQLKGIVIIIINQISEEDLKTGRLSFKGSGNILYLVDMAIFLTKNEKGEKTLTVAKDRTEEYLFSMDFKMDENDKTYCTNVRDYN